MREIVMMTAVGLLLAGRMTCLQLAGRCLISMWRCKMSLFKTIYYGSLGVFRF